jgi:hypothetical protein
VTARQRLTKLARVLTANDADPRTKQLFVELEAVTRRLTALSNP